MSLFSCFGKSKNKRDDYEVYEGTVRRSRRLSGENEVVYVDTGAFADQPKFNGNVRHVYRTENSQTPQYEKLFGPDGNRQSRSYPVSPERKSLNRVHSFEQRPSFEKQKLVTRKDSRDSRSSTIQAGNVPPSAPRPSKAKNSNDNFPFDIPIESVPRRSTLVHGVDFEKEKELLVSKGSPRSIAEKPAEEYHQSRTSRNLPVLPTLMRDDDQNNQGNERPSTLRRLREDNNEFSPSSSMASQNFVYLATDDMANEPKIKTVVRARPQSSKNFTLGSSVKPMIYRAEDNNKSNKLPPLLTTEDGKILRPLTSENAKRLSTASRRLSTLSASGNQPIRLSVTRPLDPVEENQPIRLSVTRPLDEENQPIRLSVTRPLDPVEDFPLAQGREVMVACPMIGGGGGGRRGGKAPKSKSILRRGRGCGAPAPYRGGPQAMDDYDDYPYEGEYGRGNYGQPYYDDDEEMYPFAPMDDSYSTGGGYYDDGYGRPDDMGRYGPPRLGGGRGAPPRGGGRMAHPQIYAAQMPDMTLPVDKGKSPSFIKSSDAPETYNDKNEKDSYDLKSEKSENNDEQIPDEHKVKMISSAQQTDIVNELDFICFSPDRCYKTGEAPDNPNPKLRWRIIIKRGDEE